jgi:hypothetical protein
MIMQTQNVVPAAVGRCCLPCAFASTGLLGLHCAVSKRVDPQPHLAPNHNMPRSRKPSDLYLPSDSEEAPSSAVGPADISRHERRSLHEEPPKSNSVNLPLSEELGRQALSRVALSEYPFNERLNGYGYTAVIDTSFKISSNVGHPFIKTNKEREFKSLRNWRLIGSLLLADIPLCLLHSLLDGTLDTKVKIDTPANAEVSEHFNEHNYWQTRSEGDFAPVHYVRIFADADGDSPTPAQLYMVLDDLDRYASGEQEDDEICAEIDTQVGVFAQDAQSIRQGCHRYFDGSSDRVQVLLTFITAMRQRLDEIPQDRHDQPLPYPLKYIGFSINLSRRTSAHNYRSSSWLMALFFAACKRLFKNDDDDSDDDGLPLFEFSTYAIAYPIDRDECKLGEELLCRMCDSYYYSGLGFNIQPGGLSNVAPHLEGFSEGYVQKQWRNRENLRQESPVFEQQVIFDCTTQHPKWVEVIEYYKKTPEQHQRDRDARMDEKAARLDAEHPTAADCEARIAKLEEDNREGEAAIEDPGTRDAVARVHRQAENQLREELRAATAMQ